MKLFFIILSIVVLWGCSDNKPQVVIHGDKDTIKTVIIEPVDTIEKSDLITNKNVVERLTQYGKNNKETVVDLYTSKGKIRIQLFKDTPLHRANFILLVKSGYLNGCLFSRVVVDFMAQCGGSYDEHQREVQDTIGVYSIPSEILRHRYHKKGAVGAARSYNNNPDKRSECDEFYMVEGFNYSELSLDHYEEENHYKYNQSQRNYYKANKGAAHIDGEHTVFGQIISGYSVVGKLTRVDKDSRDWPVVDLFIDSAKVIR